MFAFILLSSFLPLLPLVKRVSVMGQRQTQTGAFLRALRDIYAAVSKGPVVGSQEEVQSDRRAILHLLDEDGGPRGGQRLGLTG